MVILQSPNHLLLLLAGILILLISLLPIRRIVDAKDLSVGQKVYWSMFVALVPLAGALIWLGFDRAKGKSKQ